MHDFHVFPLTALFLLLPPIFPAQTQPAVNPPLPDIPKLMHEVEEHQKQLDKIRENYTYTSLQTSQDIDANGQVKKTETRELETFFVHGRQIGRLVKKDGKPLTDEEERREAERVTKWVKKAENPDPEKPKDGGELTVSQILEVMDVRNPRREIYRGRPAIVFDFIGRKDAKTHGMAEDMSKKLQGSAWIDEADRQVAHLDVTFNDNFRVAGGLVASVEKGSNIHFDQAPVNGELWLPTSAEGTFAVRLFMVKGLRQHITERDYDYKRFHVDSAQGKDTKVVAEQKQ